MEKDWHDIKFYTVPELATMLMAAGPAGSLENNLLRELLFCSPLLLRESLAKNRRMVIGKVMEQNNPWDVVIHDEMQLRAVHGTNKPLPDPLFIQLKELFLYEASSSVELEKWLAHITNVVRKACEKYKGRKPTGILHLYNRVPFQPTGLKQLEEKLAEMIFESPGPFKQVSITVDAKATGILSWQIYPFFHAIGSLGQLELPKLKELYDLK